MKNTIRLYSGIFVNPLDMSPEEIKIEDIAHALSQTCRFAGHLGVFSSNAFHSLRVEDYIACKFPDNIIMRILALLHDSTESYLVDLPSPYKDLVYLMLPKGGMTKFADYETQLLRVIIKGLFPQSHLWNWEEQYHLVHEADTAIKEQEIAKLLETGSLGNSYLSMVEVEKLFLDKFTELKNLL